MPPRWATVIGGWVHDDDTARPHSPLGHLAPAKQWLSLRLAPRYVPIDAVFSPNRYGAVTMVGYQSLTPWCEGEGRTGRVGESRSGVTQRRFQVLGGDLAQGFRRDYMAPNRDYMVVPAAEIAPKGPEPTPIARPRRSL